MGRCGGVIPLLFALPGMEIAPSAFSFEVGSCGRSLQCRRECLRFKMA